MNQYPAWKYVLIILVVLFGAVYALPNIFGEDPAVQVSPTRNVSLDDATIAKISGAIESASIPNKGVEQEYGRLLVRFENTADQLKGAEIVKEVLGHDYIVALNLAPATPDWLRSINAEPMYLGLDLRGGVHFLLEVDMDAALAQALSRYVEDVRRFLREEKIRYVAISGNSGIGRVKFRDAELRNSAYLSIRRQFDGLATEEIDAEGVYYVDFRLSRSEERELKRFALTQNITTLRNRVDELGVAEPIVQQQGDRRIVVQLPGVQDTAKAKEILGATATLEYRMVDTDASVQEALNGKVPSGSKLFYERDGSPVVLKKRIIVTGDQITDASSGLDQDGRPAVFVSLDGPGAAKMGRNTRKNIGKPMAVVFKENKTDTRIVDGKEVRETRTIEEVVSIASINGIFSHRFQTTGSFSTSEARDLSLLLRAGALAAPIEIIEERTIGPSLGQENIDQGFMSVVIGFVAVLIFMAVYYKVFGLVANLALALNLVLIVAVLSILQATLTLPGIAGIVLTVGMAVDANVLIYERIREEIANGSSPQASIYSGYEKALLTILDANITTLIAAVVLFAFGTGPIKGFAVTLAIGIVTSMFTAIVGTRGVINLVYGGRRVEKLAI